jgi:hypothetical protein
MCTLMLSACALHALLWHPHCQCIFGWLGFMVVLKSAKVLRIRHAVQSPILWQGPQEKNLARPIFSEAFRSEEIYQSASHRRSKWAMRKEKFLWPRAFSGISSLAPSIMMCAHLRTTFFWCWENLTAKHTAWNADSLCSLCFALFFHVSHQ